MSLTSEADTLLRRLFSVTILPANGLVARQRQDSEVIYPACEIFPGWYQPIAWHLPGRYEELDKLLFLD